MKVYLAGGMKTTWRIDVAFAVESSVFWLDPMDHEMTTAPDYVPWDLDAIREADIVFAYAESSNPTPIGLAAEIGYARALGKVIILVEDSDIEGGRRRLDFVRHLCDYSVTSIDAGVEILEKYSFIYGEG